METVEAYLVVDSDLVVTGSARAKCRALEILSVCRIDDDDDEGEAAVGAFGVLDAWENRTRTWRGSETERGGESAKRGSETIDHPTSPCGGWVCSILKAKLQTMDISFM